MPYIKRERRDPLLPDSEEFPRDAGELNYQITRLIRRYEMNHGRCYNIANDIIGALEGAKLEYYRRRLAPYEDKKIEENGDVYT